MHTVFDVTVIIVNYNSGDNLSRCLSALAVQTIQPQYVRLVDNASDDGSADHLETCYPWLQVIRCPENRGFAAANNLAVAHGQPTEWLALLNPDAFPTPDWLAVLQRVVQDHPHYDLFSCRLLDAADPERLDGAGDAFHASGLVWRQGHGQSAARSGLQSEEVFSPCAAAALYRRTAFLDAGGFDESFFCYMEDVDLGFRLRLLGYRCWYAPTATALHVGSASTGIRSAFTVYHGHRNLVWTYVKNMPTPWFWWYLPMHLALNLFSVIQLAGRGQGRIALQAKRDALRELPRIWRQRQQIQQRRRVKSGEIRRMLTGTMELILSRLIRFEVLSHHWTRQRK